MIPLAPEALQMLSQRILAQLVPDAKSPYSASDGMLVGVLLGTLVNEMEEGIARRLNDIEAMKTVFRLAGEQLGAEALPEDLDALLALAPASMTMKDVNAVHDACTRRLIALHESVDTDEGSGPARIVNDAIWQYLDNHARRHALNL